MLQLYILTKDRPEQLRIALNSALDQDNEDIEVIVSDNSEEITTSKMMLDDFGHVNYIKRTPHLSVNEHSLTVVEEATADFIMLFHDDDILKKTHVSNILLKFKQNPSVAAIASNGIFIGDYFLKNKETMNIKNELLIKSASQLFEHYLGLHPSGISNAPLSGYIYSTSILKKVLNKNYVMQCGKYSDIQVYTKVLNYGHILWLPTPTLYYRIHSNQDSSKESIYDRNKLLYFMRKHGIDLKSTSVRYFKFMYLFRWWKRGNKGIFRIPRGIKEKTIAKFLFLSLLYLCFSNITFWKKIFRLM